MSAPPLAQDIMRKRVLTLTTRMTLSEAAGIFAEHKITGAPVLCEGGKLLGVLSQSDLVRKQRRPFPRVEQAMTPWVISCDAETPVPELARRMLAGRIHRMIITRGGKLCGIVTSMDIMRAYLTCEQAPAA